MTDPTGDALVARIRVLEEALKQIRVYVGMNQSHVNHNYVLRLVDEGLKDK